MATPTSTLPPQTPQEADEAHNPSRAEFLRDFENRPVTTKNIPEAEKVSDDPVTSVRQAEKNPATVEEFDYDPTEPPKRGRISLNRQNTFKVGGGVAILLLILGGFGILLPLKIPALLQMISDEAAQRVEQVTEKRAKVILGRAIVSRFAANSGVIVTGDGAVASLIASMRTNNFEKRLAAKGLTIEKSGDGVKLRMNNDLIGNGRTLRTDIEVLRAMEGNKLTNKMLNQIVKEDIPSWRWMKKAKFAKWLRYKYSIPRYGITNSDNSDPEERVKEMQKERFTTEYRGVAASASGATQCFLTVECDVDVGDEGRPEGIKASPDASAVGDSVEGAVDETVEGVIESGETDDGVPKTLLKTVVDKLLTKAIPIVGWVDLVATADHIVYEATEHDYFGKVAAYYRATQYARHYGLWSGYGSQIQLGAMDPEFISVLAEQTEGVEGAQAFNYIEGDASKGTPAVKIGYKEGEESGFAKTLKDLRKVLAPASNIPGVNATVHFILNLYYESLGGGGLLGWLSGHIGEFLAQIASFLTPDMFEDWFAELMGKIGGKLFELLGLDFDPNIQGAEWFNATHGGATYTYNEFCQNELGCRKLTNEQANIQNRSVAIERANYRTQQGLAYALFSQETSTSVSSQLAVHTPSEVTEVAPRLVGMVASAPSKLLAIFTGRTFAEQGYVDIHNVEPYGALPEELNDPVDPRAISGEECDEAFDGEKLNLCQTDKEVAEAMLCEFEPESEDCAENEETPLDPDSGNPGTDFVLGTYNQKASWADVHDDGVNFVVSTAKMDVVGTQETAREKYGNYKRLFKEKNYGVYPEWPGSSYPRQCSSGRAIFYNNDKFKFDKGEVFDFPSYKSDNPVTCDDGERTEQGRHNAPVVWLSDKVTGQVIIVINTHNLAFCCGGGGERSAVRRYNAAQIYTAKIQELREGNPGIPIFFTGDFNEFHGVQYSRNSTYQRKHENLLFCMLKKEELMFTVFEPDNPCRGDRESLAGGVDSIYATPGVQVKSREEAPGGSKSSPSHSDHPVKWARLVVPSSGTGSLRIATFNILHVGESPFEQKWRTRLPTSIGLLKRNNITVAGLQEVRPPQHQLLKSQSYANDTYDIFPAVSDGRGFSPNPIIWNKSMFTLVEGKTLPIEYDSGSKIDHAVLVKLKDGSGNEFYVLNTHDPANARPGSSNQNALSRLHNTQFYTQYLGNLDREGKPLFLTGDFNAGYTMSGNQKPYNNNADNLAYCVISRGGVMKNVWDIFQRKPFNCPRSSSPQGAPIDHIYVANVDGVERVWTAPDHQNGSDHPTVMAEIDMPWAEEDRNPGARGWVWPIQKDLKPGPCWNVNVGDLGKHAGMDINTDNENNPVLAMHAGTITEAGYGTYEGNYIRVKTTNGMYYWYQHLKSISKRSGNVAAGEKLGIAGKTGRVFISSKAHFHVVVSKKNDYPSYNSLKASVDPMSVLPRPAPGGYRCTR